MVLAKIQNNNNFFVKKTKKYAFHCGDKRIFFYDTRFVFLFFNDILIQMNNILSHKIKKQRRKATSTFQIWKEYVRLTHSENDYYVEVRSKFFASFFFFTKFNVRKRMVKT